MSCSHHMWGDPSGPRCTRQDTHDQAATGGHVYEAADGSFVDAREKADAG